MTLYHFISSPLKATSNKDCAHIALYYSFCKTRFESCRFVNDFGHDKKKGIQREKANQEDASDDY